MHLSVVVPVYNELENLAPLGDKLHAALSKLGTEYEVLLVDDGSTDGSWERMKEVAAKHPGFKLIRLRGNAGQTAAMSAGFAQSKGDVIITLDADLQNDPADIPVLLERFNQGFDVVSGWRRDRKDPFITRRLPSIMANWLISKMTGVPLHDYGCTLKAYRREVIQDVKLYGEMHRFIPALAKWVGGTIDEVVVNHHPRIHGESKYGLSRIVRVILDLMTVKFLLNYSRGPMQAFGKIGLVFGTPGVALLGWMILANLSFRLFGTQFAADLIKRPFWLMTTFMLIFSGVQFVCMGLLAEIQIRTWHESQDKPVFVIKEVIG